MGSLVHPRLPFEAIDRERQGTRIVRASETIA
jgi:hypothetical protein